MRATSTPHNHRRILLRLLESSPSIAAIAGQHLDHQQRQQNLLLLPCERRVTRIDFISTAIGDPSVIACLPGCRGCQRLTRSALHSLAPRPLYWRVSKSLRSIGRETSNCVPRSDIGSLLTSVRCCCRPVDRHFEGRTSRQTGQARRLLCVCRFRVPGLGLGLAHSAERCQLNSVVNALLPPSQSVSQQTGCRCLGAEQAARNLIPCLHLRHGSSHRRLLHKANERERLCLRGAFTVRMLIWFAIAALQRHFFLLGTASAYPSALDRLQFSSVDVPRISNRWKTIRRGRGSRKGPQVPRMVHPDHAARSALVIIA